MTNQPQDQRLAFDIELFVGAPFTGVPQFLGNLTNEPVIMTIKNLSNVIVFFADNTGTENGTTMAAGEEIILDCRGNSGKAVNMGFPIGTPFYVTGIGGTGGIAVSVLYAK